MSSLLPGSLWMAEASVAGVQTVGSMQRPTTPPADMMDIVPTAAELALPRYRRLKRLAYVARRVKFIQELESRRVVTLMNIEGNANPADMLTKYLTKPTWFPYASRLYIQDLSKIPSSAAGVQKTRGSSTPGGGVRRDTDPSGYQPLPDS